MECSLPVRLAEDLAVGVVSIPTLLVLRLFAWLDRKQEKQDAPDRYRLLKECGLGTFSKSRFPFGGVERPFWVLAKMVSTLADSIRKYAIEAQGLVSVQTTTNYTRSLDGRS